VQARVVSHFLFMAANNSGEQSPQPRQTFGQTAKQAGLFMLFGTLLMIPRIRRLRRRVWAWTSVRLAVAVCGGWLIWRFIHDAAGVASLASGVLFLAFSLLIRAKPVVKSMDALAHEMSALIVLNGGIFRQPPDPAPIHQAQIFVHPEHIIVLGPRERRLLEIPLGKVRDLAVRPVINGSGDNVAPWEVEINWVADEPCTATFHYDGVFAEHLARVTESTLRSQWKKGLPVIAQ
jgi:hypothetical protein